MNKTTFKQIILDQHKDLDILFKKNIIERNVPSFHRADMQTDLIKVVMGVRRCGKSVYTHLMLKGEEYGYVNFDDERLIGVSANDLNDMYQTIIEIAPQTKTIVLDEIQNVEGWELFVNRLKRKGLHVLITGSNSHLLSQELSTHITGRYLSYELFPFSFREFLAFRGKNFPVKKGLSTEEKAEVLFFLEGYIERGGFPETFDLTLPYGYLRELYDKLIIRDIAVRYAVQNITGLKEIALYSLSNFGNRFSYNRIANIFQMKSVHTAQNYVDYLERVYLLFQLHAFSHKVSEHLRHPRKMYGIDTGMINALIPKTTIDRGRMIENVVFLEGKRRGYELFFYPFVSGEVDFVVRQEGKVSQLMQVCFAVNDPLTVKREVKALLKASADLDCETLTVLTWDEERELTESGKKIVFIPLWKWLLL